MNTTKRKILAYLMENGPMSAATIAADMGLDKRLTHLHIQGLRSQALVTEAEGSINPKLWRTVTEADLCKGDEDDRIKRTHVPVGQWSIDHAIHARSVFDLGAA